MKKLVLVLIGIASLSTVGGCVEDYTPDDFIKITQTTDKGKIPPARRPTLRPYPCSRLSNCGL